MNGEDLGKVLAAARAVSTPIELDVALTIVTGACVAVHQAHEAMLAGAGKYGQLSAQRIRVGFEGQVQLIAGSGDARHRAPEAGGRTDRRADVFALGVMLYEATTGQRPFDDASRDPARPSLVVPGYPPALESIVMRALAREPGRRPPTALELQRQLEGYAREHRRKLSPTAVAQLMSSLFPGRRGLIDPPSFVQHALPAFDDSDVIDTGDTDTGETSNDLPALERTGQRNLASPHHALPATLKLPALAAPPPPSRTPSASSPPLPGLKAKPMAKVDAGRAAAPRSSGISTPPSTLAGVRSSSPLLKFDEPTAQVRSLAEIERSSSASLADTSAWVPAMEPPTIASMLPLAPPPISVELALGTEPPDGRLAPSRMSAAKREASYGPPEMPRAPSPPSSSPPSRPSPSPSRSAPPEAAFAPPAAPAFAPAAPGSRNSSSMPVPGVPGAVPIVKPPPMMSMVPSGGTLVSSATIAGNPPPSAHGPSSLSGELVGRAGQSMQNFAQSYQTPPSYPAPHQGFPSTLPGIGVAPAYAPDPLEPPAAVAAAMAAPKMMQYRRRSPLPLIATAVVGLAGAFAGVWFGVLRNTDEPAASVAPTAAPVSNKRHAEPAEPAAEPTVAPSAPAPTVAPTPPAEPTVAPTPAVAPPAEPAVAPPAEPPPPPTPTIAADPAPEPPPPPTPRAASPRPPTDSAALSDPVRKKPKVHAEKHHKPESKEQSWSDDSPFMPVATPKH